MQRFFEMLKRGTQRVQVRVALLSLLVPAIGVGAWQGLGYWKQPATGPTKQVETGVAATPPETLPPAAATVSDDPTSPLPHDGTHRLVAYDQPSSAAAPVNPPPTSPYLPTSSDSPSGYRIPAGGASRYGLSDDGDSAYAANTPSPAVPADPTTSSTAADAIPENTFRSGAASAPSAAPPAYGSLSQSASLGQSPYVDPAAANSASSAPVVVPEPQEPVAISAPPSNLPPASLPPVNPAAGGYSSPYGNSSLSQYESQPATQPLVQSAPAMTPPNPLPAVSSSRGLAARSPERLSAATPGERQFEGPQQPSIVLEKVAPAEVQVGKPARFDLYIRNAGRVAAAGVTITDHVPAGTQLIDARPPPQQTAGGELSWALGLMQPGEEQQITLQVMPQTEGEVGSTAQVSFAAAATSRSICTRPQLSIEHTAPPKVLIGDALTVGITVSNSGSGAATGVVIEEDVPAGLVHAAGSQLEYDLGTLRPGESKHLDLALRADKPGMVQNTIRVHGEGNLAAEHHVQIEVVSPQLQVGIEGPKLRFLERQATYTVQVANPGTAAARDVELVAHLPRGMKFVSTDSLGQYDVSRHAVQWSLAELPQATRGAVKLTLLPIEAGEQPLRVEGRGTLGLSAVGEQVVRVEQAAELVHTVKDLDEVIELGSETTYEIRVLNKGTKAASNVRVVAIMSAGMAAIHGEGPTRASGDATQIAFEPLARLNPQEEVIYKVQAQGRQPGDQIVRVQIASDEWPSPVTREESTRVYQDR